MRTFQCHGCGGVFEATNTQEDAAREHEEIFGGAPLSDRISLCDTCFERYAPEDDRERLREEYDRLRREFGEEALS